MLENFIWPDFYIYYKASVIKTVKYRHTATQKDQKPKRESQNRLTCIFNKDAFASQWANDRSFQ